MHGVLKRAALFVLPLACAACGATTVLEANFNQEQIGDPPAIQQATGTVAIALGAGSIAVSAPPEGSSTVNHWLRIAHPTQPAPQTVMRAQFDSYHGTGRYGLLAVLFIPSGTGAVTLQLEPFVGSIASSAEFLHLDFMPENNVRVNDVDADRFGTFPRGKSFAVSIQIDSTVSPPTATIALLGNASGSKNVVLPDAAKQFGAVRIWMGSQSTGTVYTDDLIVTLRD